MNAVIATLPDGSNVLDLGEWATSELITGLELSDADRELAVSLSSGEPRLEVLELRDGVRFRSFSWVGVVHFSQVQVRIKPKYVGGDLGVLRMFDYASGLDALESVDSLRRLQTRGASLVDLLGRLLADRAAIILRRGLLEDYVGRTETLTLLRGRLRILDQVRQHHGAIDRLECEFDELVTDIVENRLLARGLGAARRACAYPSVVADVARLHEVIRDACGPDAVTPTERAGLSYHRRNEHYRDAHELAWLFIDRSAVDDLYSAGTTGSFAFLIDMNQLFEDFVTRLLRDALEPAGIRVDAQVRSRSIIENAVTRQSYASVIPDILLGWREAGASTRIPVDAKYKLYDERKLATADVFQAFFYAYAFAPRSEAKPPQAVLVYPSLDGGERTVLRIRTELGAATAYVRAVGIAVPEALEAISARRIASLPEVVALRSAILPA